MGFAAPWLLVGLASLPVLWWLLRVTPPAPRRVRFPALRLLLGLSPREETPAKTPAPPKKDCPFCFSSIPLQATRCPQCTSALGPAALPGAKA